jgi:hypothetical protein
MTWLGIDAELERAERYHARDRCFEARLFPVNKICDVPWPAYRYETFTRWTFDYAGKNLLDEGEGPPLLVDHDETKKIGQVVRLWGDDAWIRCEFRIDVDNDYAWGIHQLLLRNVGEPGLTPPPVSAAYVPETLFAAGQLEGGRIVAIADLLEVSLLIRRSPIFEGASVIASRRAHLRPATSAVGAKPDAPAASRRRAGEAPRVLVRNSGTIIKIV